LCATSLRKAYQKGVSGYHHHGRPQQHEQVVNGIDDIWVISLERRFDRWKSLLSTHPGLEANRLPAIDGQQLVLTQELYNLFQRNDFQWKKSVMGCALSHILLWFQLVSEHPSVQNYLILEDDCRFLQSTAENPDRFLQSTAENPDRFVGDWKQQLKEVMDAAPLDAELLLLGGVLPSNLSAYPSVLNPINRFWATIKPNSLFTGGTAKVEHFHFCAYSYVLTRRGAAKLLSQLQQSGCYTSLDHYLCHPTQGLKKYVLRDLITTCSQASNPVYQKAAFDEMLRIDSYDSDIWNNNSCFDVSGFATKSQQSSVETARQSSVETARQSLWPIVVDLLTTQPHSIQTRNTVRDISFKSSRASREVSSENTVYYLPDDGVKVDATLEEGWLSSIWPSIQYAPFTTIQDLPINAWVLVAKPPIDVWMALLAKATKPFRVLHMSDEGCDDPIKFYDLPLCTKVIRNYARAGLNEKVSVLPLGWAQPAPASPLPTFSERELVWGFHGAAWNNSDFDRRTILAPLQPLPNECLFQEGFHQVSDYSAMLLKSKFVPVPRGNHAETFRLYEALEHGCVPLYVRCAGDETFWNWLRSNLFLMEIADWTQAVKVITFFLANPNKAERYRTGLRDQWSKWKESLKQLFV
jgi:GR25 family glycosyltransferase involved in LPS biosynthesis